MAVTYFGNQADGDGNGNMSSGIYYACRFQNTAGTGNLSEIGLKVRTNLTGNLRLAVYADSGSSTQPAALLLDAGEFTNPTAGWQSKTGLTLAVTNNAYYWLVAQCSADCDTYWDSTKAVRSYKLVDYGAFANPFGTIDGSGADAMEIRAGVSGEEAVSVTPAPAGIAGTGDQPAPTISGSAVHAPDHVAQLAEVKDPVISGSAVYAQDHIEQLAEVVDPTLDTTQNLGVGNYRSTTVLMNW